MTALTDRLAAVNERIDSRLFSLGRSRSEVTLIVVTKNHPVDLANELYGLGCRNFGENRDQEAGPKARELAELIGDQDQPTWHFVGQLQSNKAKRVSEYADVVHSVDRASLLEALIRATEERAKPLDVFLQVNLTDDPNRGGVQPSELESFAESVLSANGLRLLGVMAVASLEGQEERDFALIRHLSEKVRSFDPEAKYISAGMSGDFEMALAYGATHLRIGTAITGNRAT
jgi:pyridoxal phosphate enzyme (YggS family)